MKELHFTVQVVESQRRYVLTGWTGRARFPIDPYEWSDSKGQCSRPTREVDFELPKCPPFPCEWAGDWEIYGRFYTGTDEADWYRGEGPKKDEAKRNSRNSSPTGGAAGTTTTTTAAGAGGRRGSGDNMGAVTVNELVDAEGAPLKYTRFDDDGWEYAFDYTRTFRNCQSSTMSWVRRRFWRRTFVVRAPSVADVEDDVPFPDRFRICIIGAVDLEKHRAAVADYLCYRPAPRVTDYKVGLRRIGLKLYRPADGDRVPRSRSQSAERQPGATSPTPAE